jgi:hypothetical protein
LGRVFVDASSADTGIALVNASNSAATVTLILRNIAGQEVNRKTPTLAPWNHVADFVSERFDNLPGGFTGTVTFYSDQPIAELTLKQSFNRRGYR